MTNLVNNTIVSAAEVMEVETLMNTVKATDIVEMETQFKIVDRFVKELFSNVPVMPRVVITKEGVQVDNILGSNGPITNHKNVKYSNQRKKIRFISVDEFGNEKVRYETVGNGTNYRYTESLIKVKVSNDLGSVLDNIKAEYVLLNVKEADAKIPVNGLVDGEPVAKYLERGYVRYAVNSWSNSDERNGGILLYNADERTPDQAFKDLDEAFGGALSAKLNSYKDGKATIEKIQKDITRNGIFNAPMMHMGTIGNSKSGILVVKEKIRGVEDYTEAQHAEMKAMGIEIDNYTYDGQLWMAASLVKRMVKDTFGFTITDEEACALSLQSRADVLVSKTYSATDYNEVIDRIAERIKANYKYFVIGNPNKIEVIVDANGYKLMTEDHAKNATNIKLHVLDIARHSMSNTSGQLLEKFMVKDSARVIKYLRKAAADRIDMYNHEKTEATDLTFAVDNNGELQIREKLTDALMIRNRKRFELDKFCMERLIYENIKLQKSAVNKLKLPVKSLFLRALFDYSKLIQGEAEYILGYDKGLDALECYSSSVTEANYYAIEEISNEFKANLANGMDIKEARRIRKAALDKILTAVTIKYPCPGSEEFQVVRFLTLEEIAERIVAKISNPKDRELVYKMFASKGDGNILISPCNTVKNKLAGMDTDYDAVAVIFEKELVDIVIESERTNTCVCIDTKGFKPEYKAKAKAKAMLDTFTTL